MAKRNIGNCRTKTVPVVKHMRCGRTPSPATVAKRAKAAEARRKKKIADRNEAADRKWEAKIKRKRAAEKKEVEARKVRAARKRKQTQAANKAAAKKAAVKKTAAQVKKTAERSARLTKALRDTRAATKKAEAKKRAVVIKTTGPTLAQLRSGFAAWFPSARIELGPWEPDLFDPQGGPGDPQIVRWMKRRPTTKAALLKWSKSYGQATEAIANPTKYRRERAKYIKETYR